MLLYSTLLCKKKARAPGGHKRFMLTKLGGGGGGAKQNRSKSPHQIEWAGNNNSVKEHRRATIIAFVEIKIHRNVLVAATQITDTLLIYCPGKLLQINTKSLIEKSSLSSTKPQI